MFAALLGFLLGATLFPGIAYVVMGASFGYENININNLFPASLIGGLSIATIIFYIKRSRTLFEEKLNAEFERKKIEETDEAKNNFLANMSHELRTPLNAILGFSHSIENESFGQIGNRKYVEYAHHIHESGQHLLDLINEILDFSSVNSRNLKLDMEKASLPDIVDASVLMVRVLSDGKKISIINSVRPNISDVRLDKIRAKQIFINLLSNAIKYTDPNGTVKIESLIEDQGRVGIVISDTGFGMTEKEIQIAMQPFAQVSRTNDHGEEGTGLGLPLTKLLVDAQGGEFKISSKKGTGTVVTVLFPCDDVAELARSA